MLLVAFFVCPLLFDGVFDRACFSTCFMVFACVLVLFEVVGMLFVVVCFVVLCFVSVCGCVLFFCVVLV